MEKTFSVHPASDLQDSSSINEMMHVERENSCKSLNNISSMKDYGDYRPANGPFQLLCERRGHGTLKMRTRNDKILVVMMSHE